MTTTLPTSSMTSTTVLKENSDTRARLALQMKDEWVMELATGRQLDFGEAMRHIERLSDVLEEVFV